MKLLFDQHLSPRLVPLLRDQFPGSVHVHEVGLGEADDRVVWKHAREHGFAVVTKDADFADLAQVFGFPPLIVWVRLGNCTTADVERLLRLHAPVLTELSSEGDVGIVSLGGLA